MEIPKGVLIDLQAIRPTLHFRLNARAVRVSAGRYDATGALRNPEYDPRWELWDTDPEGTDYKVMVLQYPDGSFRQPGQWLVDRMRFLNPERWGGDLHKLIEEAVDNPEFLREAGTEKDTDDLFEMAGKWADWALKPKEMVGKTYEQMAAEHAAATTTPAQAEACPTS